MALPLLIPVAIGVAGLFGAGKGVKAAIDNSDANDINDEAESIIRRADSSLEKAKDKTNKSLAVFGEAKLTAYKSNLHKFVTTYGKLKNVNLSESKGMDELLAQDFPQEALKEMEKSCNLAIEAFAGGGAALGGGALVAFGAYNGTMLLASAGTGTAIASLSGAAATNATLAWLGGGALSAGGLGVAGGAMVLGTLVAGPALLIFGGIVGAKAEKKLNEAKANREKAKQYKDEVRVITTRLGQIITAIEFAMEVLSKLRTASRRANKKMEKIIDQYGVDWNDFPKEAKDTILQAVKYAQLLKAMIDIPLLNKDGNLEEKSKGQIKELGQKI